MPIHRRSYACYTGRLTARGTRFLVVTRFSAARLLQSKFLLLFLALCLAYPLGCAAFIYVAHNLAFLALLNVRAGPVLQIDGRFFYFYSVVQGMLAYLLTALVGPNLISPDLANGALPLYLCRPFSRREYVAGKAAVLLGLLSLITWIPALVLFGIEASLAGWDWMTANLWLAGAILLGSWVWIAVAALLALALSAWVRWRIAAGALVLGVFFAGAGFGAAVNSVLRTTTGSVLNLNQVVHAVWASLFRYDAGVSVPVGEAWTVLAIVCLVCLAMLARRIRAFEVVR
jgi:ABC-2 type transport system permease protein